jgi:hypothetical protein
MLATRKARRIGRDESTEHLGNNHGNRPAKAIGEGLFGQPRFAAT